MSSIECDPDRIVAPGGRVMQPQYELVGILTKVLVTAVEIFA
jgi:hypothetical protein